MQNLVVGFALFFLIIGATWLIMHVVGLALVIRRPGETRSQALRREVDADVLASQMRKGEE